MSRLSAHYSTLVPEPFKKLLEFSQSVHDAGLDADLRELVNLRLSQQNGCAFCVDMHTRALLESGEDAQRLTLLPAWRECSFFSPRERAALDWAERVNARDEEALDASFAELSKHFDEKQIAALTYGVAVINAWNFMNVSLKTPVAKKPMPAAQLRKAS